ncbi:hypothetical protein J6590_044079 [Homalodisca vitripennis]|nr:hypothetical protein J6590_044079 [Homalodisca vitripennis]
MLYCKSSELESPFHMESVIKLKIEARNKGIKHHHKSHARVRGAGDGTGFTPVFKCVYGKWTTAVGALVARSLKICKCLKETEQQSGRAGSDRHNPILGRSVPRLPRECRKMETFSRAGATVKSLYWILHVCPPTPRIVVKG